MCVSMVWKKSARGRGGWAIFPIATSCKPLLHIYGLINDFFTKPTISFCYFVPSVIVFTRGKLNTHGKKQKKKMTEKRTYFAPWTVYHCRWELGNVGYRGELNLYLYATITLRITVNGKRLIVVLKYRNLYDFLFFFCQNLHFKRV